MPLRDLVEYRLRRKERITVTFDYGVHDSGNPPYEAEITKWAEKGWIEVSDTEATLLEFERLNPEAKVREVLEPKMKRYPKLMPQDPAIFGIARYGRAAYGSLGTTRDGKHIYQIMEEFKKIMFPNFDKLKEETKIRAHYDILHISCHYIFNRDVFLTRNFKHFEKVLETHKDIVITTPETFIEIGEDYFKDES